MAAIEAEFECGVEGEPQLQLRSDNAGPVMVAEDSDRLSLSRLLNSLLELPEPVAFEFLVTLEKSGRGGAAQSAKDEETADEEEEGEKTQVQDEGEETERLLVVSTLKEFMEKHQLSAEKRLRLTYVLARQPLQEAPLMPSPQWVLGVGSLDRSVVAACSDGMARCACTTVVDGSGPLRLLEGSFVQEQLSGCPLTSVAVHSLGGRTEILLGSMDGEVLFCGARPGNGGPCMLARSALQPGSAEAVAVTAEAAFAGGSSCNVTVFSNHSRADRMLMSGEDADGTRRKRQREGDPLSNPPVEPDAHFVGHKRPILDLCPASNYLLSASLDSTVRVWDLKTAKQAALFPVGRSALSVTTNSQGTLFATSGDDRRVRVWDLRNALGVALTSESTAALRCTLPPAKRSVSRARWNPFNQTQLAVGAHDGTLTVYDMRAPGDALQRVHWVGKKVLALHWVSDKHIICGGTDDQLRSVWVP